MAYQDIGWQSAENGHDAIENEGVISFFKTMFFSLSVWRCLILEKFNRMKKLMQE